MTNKKKEYYSVIQSTIHISESEIAILYPDYQYSWFENNTEKLKGILFDLGADTNQYFEYHEPTQHRNRLGKVVTCGRYFCQERLDNDWIKSGYASEAAKDKVKNSRMLDDLYRAKGLTVDMQEAMERKDKYKEIEDEEGEEYAG